MWPCLVSQGARGENMPQVQESLLGQGTEKGQVKMHRGRPRTNIEDRFWLKVALRAHSECWMWLGAKDHDGYGRVSRDGKLVAAHRVAYELGVGLFDDGDDIHHLCHRPLCMNPKHMRVLSHGRHVQLGNSPSAQAARRTHCPQGHPYDEANTRYTRQGWRECRVCG